jgi:hypothetical protein
MLTDLLRVGGPVIKHVVKRGRVVESIRDAIL